MYNQRVIGILMVLAATLIASISQILLKHSANADHKSRCAEYLNIFVVLGYGLLLATTVINVFALRRFRCRWQLRWMPVDKYLFLF